MTATKMYSLGIRDKLDLKNCDCLFLTPHFGKASNYYNIARSKDDRIVEANRIRKSIGAENSFAENFCDR